VFRGVVQVAELLPRKHKALNLDLNTTKIRTIMMSKRKKYTMMKVVKNVSKI
jgi:hypothetical protein